MIEQEIIKTQYGNIAGILYRKWSASETLLQYERHSLPENGPLEKTARDE